MKENIETVKYYNQKEVAETYDDMRFKSISGKVVDILQKNAVYSHLPKGSLKGLKILDVGCGTGRFMEPLLKRGAQVYGFDASSSMIEVASEKLNGYNPKFFNGRAETLPFKNKEFDYVISVWVLNHLSTYPQIIKEMSRVGKNVILGLPNKYSIFIFSGIYRKLKGVNKNMGAFKINTNLKHPTPYSILFTYKELSGIFKESGFSRIFYKGSLMFYFAVPGIFSRLYRIIDPILCILFGRLASFMAIKGTN